MNRKIAICDCTLLDAVEHMELSFREKIELCRLVDRLGVSAIELSEIKENRIDRLLIKSICSAVQQAIVAVPVSLTAEDSVRITWDALREAGKARLQVVASVSSVQMEYLLHLKPAQLLSSISKKIQECKSMTNEVEFIAADATRSDPDFLRKAVSEALQAGASMVTFCDTAGSNTPDETAEFFHSLCSDLPELRQVKVGFYCSNELNLADANAYAALKEGVNAIKESAQSGKTISLNGIVRILRSKGSLLNTGCGIQAEILNRTMDQIHMICTSGKRGFTPLPSDAVMHDKDIMLSRYDSCETVLSAAERLGFDLNTEDQQKVWAAFMRTAEKKESISLKELDAIIAAEAMQVPPAYHDIHYIINTDNSLGAMSHVKLMFHDQEIEGIASGDGTIDAAFNAIEKATGKHYELDDFQIQSVTEGREAIGETIIKLRHDGKLYSGRGISTDIVGAGIMAYLNAVNKIIYEEEDA